MCRSLDPVAGGVENDHLERPAGLQPRRPLEIGHFQIILYWVLTVPAAAITSIVIFKILKLFL